MTDIIELKATALTDSEATLKTAIAGIGTIVDLKPGSLALAANGLQVQKLIDAIADDLEIASSMTIDSPEMLAEAEGIAGRLASVAADSGSIEDERKALTSPFNDLVKKINAGYNAPKEYIGGVLGSLKTRILAYNREQREIAEKQAAEERQKRADEAAAAALREAEATAEAHRLVEQAEAAQRAGSEITAGALLNEASIKIDAARQDATAAVTAMHTRVAAVPAARASGVRGAWKAETINKSELILHVADRIRAGDMSLLALLDANDSALNAKAKIEKEGFRVPGVRAEFVESLAVRKSAVTA